MRQCLPRAETKWALLELIWQAASSSSCWVSTTLQISEKHLMLQQELVEFKSAAPSLWCVQHLLDETPLVFSTRSGFLSPANCFRKEEAVVRASKCACASGICDRLGPSRTSLL